MEATQRPTQSRYLGDTSLLIWLVLPVSRLSNIYFCLLEHILDEIPKIKQCDGEYNTMCVCALTDSPCCNRGRKDVCHRQNKSE
jgi:hypothetical protein